MSKGAVLPIPNDPTTQVFGTQRVVEPSRRSRGRRYTVFGGLSPFQVHHGITYPTGGKCASSWFGTAQLLMTYWTHSPDSVSGSAFFGSSGSRLSLTMDDSVPGLR